MCGAVGSCGSWPYGSLYDLGIQMESMMKGSIERIRFHELYIQIVEDSDGSYMAWSSVCPSDNPVTAPGVVYFNLADTRDGVIEKLKEELIQEGQVA